MPAENFLTRCMLKLLVGGEQVKILRDEVKGMPSVGGRSRGAAFVEFTEHQHALVALRVLNNNPGLFCFLTLALSLL